MQNTDRNLKFVGEGEFEYEKNGKTRNQERNRLGSHHEEGQRVLTGLGTRNNNERSYGVVLSPEIRRLV